MSTQNSNSNEDDKEQKKATKRNFEMGVFTGNYKNDGVSGEFDSLSYPHSREMLKVKHIIPCNYFKNYYFLIITVFVNVKIHVTIVVLYFLDFQTKVWIIFI